MPINFLASGTAVIWRLLQEYGYDPEAIFRDHNIDPEVIKKPGTRIAYSDVMVLWNSVVEMVKDPCIGLRVAEYWHPSDMNALGYAWLASSNLNEAFNQLIRYTRCISEAVDVIIEETNTSFKIVYSNKIASTASHTLIDASLAILVKMCRLNLGDQLNPIDVHLSHSPPFCYDNYEQYFNANIYFDSPDNSFSISRKEFKKPLLSSNPYLLEINDQFLIKYMARLDEEDIVSRVKAKIMEILPSGNLTDDMVSSELYTSVRTLQRKLKSKGTTYQTIVNEIRKDLAVKYIKNPNIRLEEIAFLIGYSEYSTFSRAFKRWTGSAPSAYQEMIK